MPYSIESKAQNIRIQINRLKSLREKLTENIQFIAAKLILYYNKYHNIKPTLKKGNKVYLIQRNIKIKKPSDKLDYKKIRLYKIKKVKSPINYEFALFNNINIYLVFYIFLLELILLKVLKTLKIKIKLINLNAKYDIKEILDY